MIWRIVRCWRKLPLGKTAGDRALLVRTTVVFVALSRDADFWRHYVFGFNSFNLPKLRHLMSRVVSLLSRRNVGVELDSGAAWSLKQTRPRGDTLRRVSAAARETTLNVYICSLCRGLWPKASGKLFESAENGRLQRPSVAVHGGGARYERATLRRSRNGIELTNDRGTGLAAPAPSGEVAEWSNAPVC